jgi:hypothetical protein
VVASPKRTPWVYNGIDRIDSSAGYVPSNVVPCCHDCNFMKGSLGYDEFFDRVAAIHQRRVGPQSSL